MNTRQGSISARCTNASSVHCIEEVLGIKDDSSSSSAVYFLVGMGELEGVYTRMPGGVGVRDRYASAVYVQCM